MNPHLKKTLGLFFSLLLPISFVLIWKLQYQMYPQGDEAFYKIISQEIYLTAKQNGLMEGIKFAYTHKHWKPVLHPVIGAVTLWLVDGNIRQSIALYNLLVYSLFLTLIYFYISRYIGEFRSVFAILFLSSIPWVFGISTNFNSEIGFLTSIVAILLFYSYHPDINSKKSAIVYALLFSISSSLRPVETALLFGVFIVGYLAEMKKKNKISFIPILFSVVWLIFFAIVMSAPYFKLLRDWYVSEIVIIFFIAALIFIATLWLSKKHAGNFYHTVAISLYFLIQLLWYAPAAYTFFDWIVFANFGALAQQTGNRLGRPFVDFLYFYWSRVGIAPLFLLILICISYTKSVFNLLKNYRLWLFIAGSLILPFVAGSLSYNGDVRYYYGAWIIGMLLLLRTALNNSSNRLIFTTTAVSVFSIILFIGLFPYILGEHRNIVPWGLRNKFGFSFYNLHAKKFSAEPMTLKILKEITKNTDFNYNFYLFFKPNGDINESPDPFGLTLTFREHGHNWTAEFTGFTPEGDLYVRHSEDIKKFDYVIVGPLGDHWSFNNSKWQQLTKKIFDSCINEKMFDSDISDTFLYLQKFSLTHEGTELGKYCVLKNNTKTPALPSGKFH